MSQFRTFLNSYWVPDTILGLSEAKTNFIPDHEKLSHCVMCKPGRNECDSWFSNRRLQGGLSCPEMEGIGQEAWSENILQRGDAATLILSVIFLSPEALTRGTCRVEQWSVVLGCVNRHDSASPMRGPEAQFGHKMCLNRPQASRSACWLGFDILL